MIVRILTEGQYRVEDGSLAAMNRLDNQLVEAVSSGDEWRYQDLFGQLITLVRDHGKQIPADELHGSDVILPAPDTTLEEARKLFTGEGVIPG